MAFSPDGKRIVSGSAGQDGEGVGRGHGPGDPHPQGAHESVTSVAFSPDGKRIVSGSEDETVKVWDADTGQEILTLKGHTSGVASVAFSPDGKRIVSGSRARFHPRSQGTGHASEVKCGTRPQATRSSRSRAGRVRVAFSADGKRIVSGSRGRHGGVEVWDAATGQEVLTLKGARMSRVAFSADGKRIVSGGEDTMVGECGRRTRAKRSSRSRDTPAGHQRGVQRRR